jgi:antitoxin CptB
MDERRLNKLRFRAWRRGFREADLILGPFADAHVQTMTEEELSAFEKLLEENDHDLYAWLTGKAEPPAESQSPVLEALQRFVVEQGAVIRGSR